MKKYQRPRGFSTEAIHAGYDPDPQTGARALSSRRIMQFAAGLAA